MNPARVVLKKQPQKYLEKVDNNTYRKIYAQLTALENGTAIVNRLTDSDYYRVKIEQYRIMLKYNADDNTITIYEINTRTNINYRRYM